MNIRNVVTQTIRIADGRNTAKPATLAAAIQDELQDWEVYVDLQQVADVIARHNPDKTMGAAALADVIVDELGLDDA